MVGELVMWGWYDFIILKGEQFTELFNHQKGCIGLIFYVNECGHNAAIMLRNFQ